MVPCSFAESNLVLGKPPEMTHDECEPLSVCFTQSDDGHPLLISCWKITSEEIEEFQRTGRIWLYIFGAGMPPVALTANSPFGKENE